MRLCCSLFPITLVITIAVAFVFTNPNPQAYAVFTIEKEDKDDNLDGGTTVKGNSTETTNDENIAAKIILTNIKYKSDKFSDHLLGQITNVGNETAQKVRVLLSYYDKENFYINRGYVSPEIDTLEPGQKSGFNIMIDEKTGDKMEAYKVSFKWSHPDGSKGYAENVEIEDEANYFVEPSPKKLTDEEIEKLGLFER